MAAAFGANKNNHFESRGTALLEAPGLASHDQYARSMQMLPSFGITTLPGGTLEATETGNLVSQREVSSNKQDSQFRKYRITSGR